MSLGPLYVLLGEVSVWVFCPFFNWMACLPGVELCEFFINLEIKPFCKISLASIFSHTVGSFHFNAVFFSHAEAFYFDEVPFVYSFLYAPCFRGRVCEDVAVWNV